MKKLLRKLVDWLLKEDPNMGSIDQIEYPNYKNFNWAEFKRKNAHYIVSKK